MDGEAQALELGAYLTRLTGQPVATDQPLGLRSVERAALAAWARARNIPLPATLIGSRTAFSIRDLLGGVEHLAPSHKADRPAPRQASPAGGAVLGIGIDIEDVDALPPADDYRDHPFFQAAFTAAEIARCIRQADVGASFCGLWAAKEAVVKSGAADGPADGLRAIEIGWDEAGRPIYPDCRLSISHTRRSAVAVCLWSPSPASPLPTVQTPAIEPPPSSSPESRRWLMGLFAVLGVALGGTLAFLAIHA